MKVHNKSVFCKELCAWRSEVWSDRRAAPYV